MNREGPRPEASDREAAVAPEHLLPAVASYGRHGSEIAPKSQLRNEDQRWPEDGQGRNY